MLLKFFSADFSASSVLKDAFLKVLSLKGIAIHALRLDLSIVYGSTKKESDLVREKGSAKLKTTFKDIFPKGLLPLKAKKFCFRRDIGQPEVQAEKVSLCGEGVQMD